MLGEASWKAYHVKDLICWVFCFVTEVRNGFYSLLEVGKKTRWLQLLGRQTYFLVNGILRGVEVGVIVGTVQMFPWTSLLDEWKFSHIRLPAILFHIL